MKLNKTQKNFRKQMNKIAKEGNLYDRYGDKITKINWKTDRGQGFSNWSARDIIILISWIVFLYRIMVRFGMIENIKYILNYLIYYI